jgi:sulfur carrier protein ThiS
MITLTLPTPLASFITGAEGRGGSRPRSLLFDAGTWAEFGGELRERFPLLAARVLTASGALAPGFVLVINDEALPANGAACYDIHDGDQVALIAALAGG